MNFLTGDIEKYGTGFQRIRKAIIDYPTMKFTYREIQSGFLVEFSYEIQKESMEKNVERMWKRVWKSSSG